MFLSECESDDQCAEGETCDPISGCGKRATGQVCENADECESGNCVDGVCCNQPCEGTCQACNIEASMGICSPLAARMPDAMCETMEVSSCGTTGRCDGAGNCSRYVGGVSCSEGRCEAGREQPGGTCDGEGSCLTEAPFPASLWYVEMARV